MKESLSKTLLPFDPWSLFRKKRKMDSMPGKAIESILQKAGVWTLNVPRASSQEGGEGRIKGPGEAERATKKRPPVGGR